MSVILGLLVLGSIGVVGMGCALAFGTMQQVENWLLAATIPTCLSAFAAVVLL